MNDALRTFSSAGRLAFGRLGLLGSRQRLRADQTGAGGPRGRLFRKYVLLFIGLISLVLLLNSVLDFWFTYDENKAALFRIQRNGRPLRSSSAVSIMCAYCARCGQSPS
jgi:hypothetical protein